jgi:uncharacterized protein (DUF58 family)
MLTSRGAGLLSAGLVLAGVTALTRAVELLVLVVPALTLPLLAWAWCRVPFRIGVRRWVEPATVTRGEPCIGAIAVTNDGHRRTPALDVLDRRGDEEDVFLPVPRLDPGATHPTTYHLPTDRRGVYLLGPLRARRGDPLGLAGTTADLGGRMTLCVHPRRRYLDSVPGGVRASLEGIVEQIPFGSSVFHGLREYVPGDDHRHIHWMSTARLGVPQVRVYRDSSIPTLTVLLDDRTSRYRGDRFEDAVEVVASVVDLAARNDLALVVATAGGDRHGTAGEPVREGDALDFLAHLTPRADEDTAWAAAEVSAAATVVLVCGRQAATDEAELLRLRAVSARLTVCALVDDDEPVGVPEATPLIVLPDAGSLPDHWAAVTR